MRSLKVNCGYRCAFCMAKSVVPPTFSQRSSFRRPPSVTTFNFSVTTLS